MNDIAPDSNPWNVNYQPTLFESESPAFDTTKTRANGKKFILEAAASYFGDPRSAYRVDVLERVLERQVRQLTGRVLGHPQRLALDCTAEANVSAGLGGHERMFS